MKAGSSDAKCQLRDGSGSTHSTFQAMLGYLRIHAPGILIGENLDDIDKHASDERAYMIEAGKSGT